MEVLNVFELTTINESAKNALELAKESKSENRTCAVLDCKLDDT
jgi:hypothetical protein